MTTVLVNDDVYMCIYVLFIFICTNKHNQNTTRFGNKLSNSDFVGLKNVLRLEEMKDWLKLLKFGRICSNCQIAIGMNTKKGESTIFKAKTE